MPAAARGTCRDQPSRAWRGFPSGTQVATDELRRVPTGRSGRLREPLPLDLSRRVGGPSWARSAAGRTAGEPGAVASPRSGTAHGPAVGEERWAEVAYTRRHTVLGARDVRSWTQTRPRSAARHGGHRVLDRARCGRSPRPRRRTADAGQGLPRGGLQHPDTSALRPGAAHEDVEPPAVRHGTSVDLLRPWRRPEPAGVDLDERVARTRRRSRATTTRSTDVADRYAERRPSRSRTAPSGRRPSAGRRWSGRTPRPSAGWPGTGTGSGRRVCIDATPHGPRLGGLRTGTDARYGDILPNARVVRGTSRVSAAGSRRRAGGPVPGVRAGPVGRWPADYDSPCGAAAGAVPSTSGFADERHPRARRGADGRPGRRPRLARPRRPARPGAGRGAAGRRRAGRARLLSICSGAFAAGRAAGVLDGRRATTHWQFADRLARPGPAGPRRTRRALRDDGHVRDQRRGRRRDRRLPARGPPGARRRTWPTRSPGAWCVPAHRDGRAGPVRRDAGPGGAAGDGNGLADVLDWAERRPRRGGHRGPPRRRGPHVAADASPGASGQATGVDAAPVAVEQRLQRAELLLETTDLTVEVVARRSGFGSADTLRHHFARRRGTSPGGRVGSTGRLLVGVAARPGGGCCRRPGVAGRSRGRRV